MATATLFAENGFQVAAVSRSGIAPNKTLAVRADITNAEDVSKMADTVHSTLGDIDILINNAGIALPQDVITNISEVEYTQVFDTNMKGMHLCTSALLPDMLKKKSGCILNVSSIWGICGASCEAVYAASKAAVIGYTKSLAKELGLSGIRVNCIAPGFIETPMTEHLSAQDKAAFAQQTALNRIGKPQEVAHALLFLATAATYITGQTLCIDGGYCI